MPVTVSESDLLDVLAQMPRGEVEAKYVEVESMDRLRKRYPLIGDEINGMCLHSFCAGYMQAMADVCGKFQAKIHAKESRFN